MAILKASSKIIDSIYTRYFNKKYNYIGHLFQAKYFSELIESDKKIIWASEVVEGNKVTLLLGLPVNFQISKRLEVCHKLRYPHY